LCFQTRVLIEGAMSASSMFNNLSKEQCEAVIGAMYPAQRPAGEPVIIQVLSHFSVTFS